MENNYLIELVKKECELLKAYSTSSEKKKLVEDDFNPKAAAKCFYGLLTGHCQSPRALELIRLCEPNVGYKWFGDTDPSYVAGSEHRNWTALEYFAYNCTDSKKLKVILNYLKGSSQKLEL